MSDERAHGVLVTAATTPLGRKLVERLRADGSVGAVLAVSRESVDDAPPGVTPIACDLTRYRDIHRLVHETAVAHRVRAIVHAPLHRSAADEGRDVWRLNVESTRLLLSLAEEEPAIERFVLRSFAEIYRIESDLPTMVTEDHPLHLSPEVPQRVRDRIEADAAVCAHLASTGLRVAVLRCAELLAPDSGSELYDYLGSRVCLRALGYDPLLNVLSLDDAARALALAAANECQGVFNVPGFDTLPLSALVAHAGRVDVPIPGPLLGGLYSLRARATGREFHYPPNRGRFHFGSVLDGRRALAAFGYAPAAGIDWRALARNLRGSTHEFSR